MWCLLRHVLPGSVAFKSIIHRGHFPLFSPWSSIFHLCARGPMHWGTEFDFKIHWKQLAPSLPSPILFHLALAFAACVHFTAEADLRALRACFAELDPKACTEIRISQIVPNHCRALKQIRGRGMSSMTSLEQEML